MKFYAKSPDGEISTSGGDSENGKITTSEDNSDRIIKEAIRDAKN